MNISFYFPFFIKLLPLLLVETLLSLSLSLPVYLPRRSLQTSHAVGKAQRNKVKYFVSIFSCAKRIWMSESAYYFNNLLRR